MKLIRCVVPLLLVCGWGTVPAATAGCEAAGGLQFICGPKNAEDLVSVPGTQWIIASGAAAGAGLTLVAAATGAWEPIYPGAGSGAKHDSAFPDCTAPPDTKTWITHGLNLRAGADRHSKLYVVSHGNREAIEVFDVDATGAKPTLTWRGCVPMPAGLAANSVASFPNGALVATVLLMPGKSFADSVAGKPTGAVYEWVPGQRGFTLLRGTQLPGNNGIEVAEDGSEIFVVSSGLQTIVAFSHSNPARQLRTTAPFPITPDNVHRGTDGRLLTAGMKNDVPACGGAPGPKHDLSKLSVCPRGTIALAIDPASMQHSVLLETPANPAFSNATMVLVQGRLFWLGSFSGDRIGHGVLL